MKVKVNVKHTQVEEMLHESLCATQKDLASAHEEIEKLFQENKDLRVSEGHLHDELNQLKSRFTDVRIERDNLETSFKQMTSWWDAAITEKNKAQEKLHSTQIELADRNERIFILEQRVRTLEQENEELRNVADQLSVKVINQNTEINQVSENAYDLSQKNLELEMTIVELRNAAETYAEEKAAFETAIHSFEEARKEYEEDLAQANAEKRGWMNRFHELEAQKKRDDQKCEDTCNACNKLYEEVYAERNRLREEVARLTTERDTAVKENSELIFQINSLNDELDAAITIKNDYAEQIGELRNQVQQVKNNATGSFWNFLVEHGLIKTEDELGGTTNET